MPRPCEFNRDAVLEKAMHVFWRRGYEATSIQDLVDATGLNRGSIYNAFDDKFGLFKAVMTHYADQAPSKQLVAAAKTGAPLPTIRQFFNDILHRAKTDPEQRGCLVTNTATELSALDPHIQDWAQSAMKRIEDALATLVKRGQADGTIANNQKPRALARMLLACAQGVNVLAKTSPDPRLLTDVVKTTLATLDR